MRHEVAQRSRGASTDRGRTCALALPPSEPHPVRAEQLLFARDCARVLRLAQARGDRLVVALYLVLSRHRAVPAQTRGGQQHLSCAECRPDGREPAAQYPCPSAQQAFWALDAVLR